MLFQICCVCLNAEIGRLKIVGVGYQGLGILCFSIILIILMFIYLYFMISIHMYFIIRYFVYYWFDFAFRINQRELLQKSGMLSA